MNRTSKDEIIKELVDTIAANKNFYLADISTLSVNDTNALRRLCFEKGIKLQVVKNTLIEKALAQAEITSESLVNALKGPSSLMFSENINAPAKLIKEFRKKNPKFTRPELKAAYVEESVYVGDHMLDTLISLKTREELIADVVALLQSPMRNVISGLQSSGGQKIAGLLKTLSEKES